MHARWIPWLLLVFLGGPARSAEPVNYAREIAPIFRAHCAGCHNDRDLEGKLSLETFAQLRRGGEDHADPIRPGDADGSFLMQSLEGRARPAMPPKDEPRVSEADRATIRRWIAEGARGPGRDLSILRSLETPSIRGAKVPPPLTSAAYASPGSVLALAHTGAIEIRDGAGGAVRRTLTGLPGKVNAVHFSPDGRRLVAATGLPGLHGVAQLFDVESGGMTGEFGGHADVLYDAEFSPDGTLLATAGYDRAIRLWRVEDGALLRSIDVHKGAIFDLAWHPSGAVLASASADETVKLWRVSDGLRLDTLNQPQGAMVAVLFTASGDHVVAAGADRRIHLWRFVSREAPALNPVVHSRFAHESALTAIAISADGRSLLSSAADRSVKLWSLPDIGLRRTYDTQPDVVTGLIAEPGTNRFLVIRMDGSTGTVTIPDTDAVKEASNRTAATAAAGPAGPVGDLHEIVEAERNDDGTRANRMTLPAEVSGAIAAPGDADLFRFRARAGEALTLEVNAARSKSRLDSRVEVLHADGRPVEQVVLQATRDSWFTFRGKDSETADDFRLHNWAEMELNEYLYANGEVVRLWLYPRGPDSGFKVYPGEGRRHTYFSTTALVHALGAPSYIVSPLAPGADPAPNGLPVFRLNYVNDDDPGRRFGADSVLLFTAPADGEYLARVTDVRGFGAATGYHYTLAVRPPRPGFKVTLSGLDPKVSPGSGREITVKAERWEGFVGPIRIGAANLPPGFDASLPLAIEAGQSSAVGVLYADPTAIAPDAAADAAVRLTASATVDGREVVQELGTLGDIQLGPPAKVTVEILPATDRAFVKETPGRSLEFSVSPGQSITARVRAVRHDFTGRIEFGNEDSGRNLPHGVYVDNIGLNGLLIVEGQTEREFLITASPVARPGSRFFHLRARADDGQASRPAIIRVLPPPQVAAAQ